MYPWAYRAALAATATAWGLLLLAEVSSTTPFLVTGGLCAIAGLLLGVPFGLAQAGVSALPRRARWGIWLIVGVLIGLYLSTALGFLGRARGEFAAVRILSIAGLAGALLLGAPLALIQPAKCDAPGLDWNVRAKWAAAVVLLIFSLVIAVYESSAWWLRAYLAFRKTLVATSWLLASVSVLMALELLAPRFLRRAHVGSCALLGFGVLAVAWAPSAQIQNLASQAHVEHLVSVLRSASDWDRDGSSSFLGGGDCAPFDPEISPRAKEIPDNGKDDNCRYGDAKGIPKPPPTHVTAKNPPPVNVLLVTIDSLRMDHTTPYGYSRNTTPHLAELARRGTLYKRAYTSGGWTCLALPSMFMGSYSRRMPFRPLALTWEHDLLELPFEPKLRKGDNFRLMVNAPKPESAWLLHRTLAERGMETIAVYSWYVRYVVDAVGGGWGRQVSPSREEDSDRKLTDLALAELAGVKGKPFFMWVHYFDPHDPPSDHEGAPKYGDSRIDHYDHEVASSDRELGRLVAAVDALTERPTVIVVAADHGEAFEPNFQFHGVDLFEESVRIPLVLRSGSAPAVVESPVSLVDIAPTILRLTESPAVANLDGVDLESPQPNRVVLTDLWRLNQKAEPEIDQVGATDGQHRLVLDRMNQTVSLYSTSDWARPPQALSRETASSRLQEAVDAYEEYHVGGP